jgi:MtN3 and saliva related transmembrane protein
MNTLFDTIQLIGGIILSAGYIPQIYKILVTKSAKDLSLQMFGMILFGLVCMELYAINLAAHNVGWAFLITNSLGLIASLILCILIMIYGKRKI